MTQASLHRSTPFLLLLGLLVLLLPACAGSGIKRPIISTFTGYQSALHYYENGEIMLARRASANTDPSRPDFPQTQALLKKKIEPARLRLLRHYRRSARIAEKRGVLYRAKALYIKAAGVWIGDDSMLKQAARIDLMLRQKRINHLSKQRRKEDKQLLDTLSHYNPPSGLDPKDAPFARELDRMQNLLLARGRSAWQAAKRELREGHAEVAYVEAESYQRLRPGSRRGPLLMQEVRQALPAGLHIPREEHPVQRTAKPGKPVSSEQIKQLIAEGKWIQAHDYAIIYRRNGGDDADDLLRTIDKTLKKQAEASFKTGQLAFRNEQLDKAVTAWSQAAALQPDNRDYTDSLQRARELQERFNILQDKHSGAGK
ncbi:MAG: hypothetical protein Q9M30_06690 [Mariprofundaceae bacterium]|nr:hypothetical protein [Mariprofundaceae bacterium]